MFHDGYTQGAEKFLEQGYHRPWESVKIFSCDNDFLLNAPAKDLKREDVIIVMLCSEKEKSSNTVSPIFIIYNKDGWVEVEGQTFLNTLESASPMTQKDWVVVITDNDNLIKELQQILVKGRQMLLIVIDCCSVVIYYASRPEDSHRVKMKTVGRWQEQEKIPEGNWSIHFPIPAAASQKPLDEPRHDFNGKELKVAAVDNWPWFGVLETEGQEPLPGNGIDVSIINTLSRSLNFTYKVVIPADGQWGGPQPDGSVSGLIGMVARGDAHLAIDEITITASRETVVDFTFPYYIETSTCVSRAPTEKSRAFAILSPFTLEVWLSIGLSVFVVGLLLFFTHLLSSPFSSEKSSFTLNDLTFHTFRNMVVQDNLLYIPHGPMRCLFGAWYLYCYYVYALYSGTLTAVLSVPSFEKPIDSLSDVLHSAREGFYPVIFREGSIDFLFKFATSGVYHDIGALISEDRNYVDVIADGVETTLQNKAVYIEARLAAEMQTLRQGREKFYMGRQSFFPQGYGIVCKEGSYFKDIFSKVLAHLNEGGLINKWKNEQVMKLSQNPSAVVAAGGGGKHHIRSRPSAITMDHLQGAFFVYVIGIAVAFIFLLLERMGIFETKRYGSE